MGTLARALQDFFLTHRLAMPLDQAERLAAGRRQRRIDGVPAPLRPAVAEFAGYLLQTRERARRAGTRPRTDITLEAHLSIVRDLARLLLTERGQTDWATVDVHDIEAFLASNPASRKRRLTALRHFFRWARVHKHILIDPTTGIRAIEPRGFRGRTLDLPQQRQLFRRWTTGDTHPHEALVGLLALLHGASSAEARLLTIDDIDHATRARPLTLGRRQATRHHPTPH